MQKTRSDSTKPSWRTTRTSLVTFVKTGDLKELRHSDVRESEKYVSGLGIAAHDNLPIKHVNFIPVVRCNNLMRKKNGDFK